MMLIRCGRRAVDGLFHGKLVAATTSRYSTLSSNLIDIHPEVRSALASRGPVVALESTIITHGMPYPHNLQTAMDVEDIVRKQKAIPATIAIINGRVKVGLEKEELTNLANLGPEKVVKCSRRDLGYAVSRKLNGGTTVAGTSIIANMVGIKVFATGGIGGVHRDGHITMDVSADLIELGRTAICVVSSGIKSILDIPRTLEYLETQGVCVATYQSDTGHFPAFYTRSSGVRVPYNLKTALDAALMIKSSLDMKLESGILIGVPIPEEYASDETKINKGIEKALAIANEKGVVGKEVTPFVLEAISKVTEGKSLESNIALIKNNALVAAQISVELSKLSDNQVSDGESDTKINTRNTNNVPPCPNFDFKILGSGGGINSGCMYEMLRGRYQVWTGDGIPMKIEMVKRDDSFFKSQMEKQLEFFYFNSVLPELIDPRHTRGMEIRDPEYITAAIEENKVKKLKSNGLLAVEVFDHQKL